MRIRGGQAWIPAGQPLKRADGQVTDWQETLRKLREIRAEQDARKEKERK